MSGSPWTARLGRALAVALPLAALPLVVTRSGEGLGPAVVLAVIGLVVRGGGRPWAGCVRIPRQIPLDDESPAALPRWATRARVYLARTGSASAALVRPGGVVSRKPAKPAKI